MNGSKSAVRVLELLQGQVDTDPNKLRHARGPRTRYSKLQRIFHVRWQQLVLDREVWTKPEEVPPSLQFTKPAGILPKLQPSEKRHWHSSTENKRKKWPGQD